MLGNRLGSVGGEQRLLARGGRSDSNPRGHTRARIDGERRLLTRAALILTVSLCCTGCGNLFTAREAISLDADWGAFERVIVETRNGDVDVRVSGASAVGGAGSTAVQRVRVSGEKWAGGGTLESAEELLGQLHVTAGPDAGDPRALRVKLDYAEAMRMRSYGADLKIELPTAASAEIHTTNGRVEARGLVRRVFADTSNGNIVLADIDGDVQVDTSNGGVRAERVRGSLAADTSNGSIVAREIGGECRLDTSNGNVEVVGAKGGIRADSSNGWLRIDADPPAEAVIELTTSNGGITARLPGGLRGELHLRTSNGSIETDLGPATLSNPSWSKEDIRARLNGGGAGRLTARTSNGSVRLTCR